LPLSGNGFGVVPVHTHQVRRSTAGGDGTAHALAVQTDRPQPAPRRRRVVLPDFTAVPGARGISGALALAWIGIGLLVLALDGALPRCGVGADLAQIGRPDVDQVGIAGGQHGGGVAGERVVHGVAVQAGQQPGQG
jgi:hypothetical protein